MHLNDLVQVTIDIQTVHKLPYAFLSMSPPNLGIKVFFSASELFFSRHHIFTRFARTIHKLPRALQFNLPMNQCHHLTIPQFV